MVLAFSLTFFGIRSYRNGPSGGVISFGKAFKVGALIVLVASTLYVAFWLPYYYLVAPDFLDCYIDFMLKDATRSGATAAELAAKAKEMEGFKEMYKNPFFIVLITYSEVLPVGMAVALVSALALRKKARVEAA
jgi:hypothetical protein